MCRSFLSLKSINYNYLYGHIKTIMKFKGVKDLLLRFNKNYLKTTIRGFYDICRLTGFRWYKRLTSRGNYTLIMIPN